MQGGSAGGDGMRAKVWCERQGERVAGRRGWMWKKEDV